MRKKMLLIALGFVAIANAQSFRVRPVEFEMHVGATRPLGGNIENTDKKVGAGLGLELRYNFKNSPLDVGLAIDISTAVYGWKPDEYDRQQSNRTAFVGFTGDYNFKQGGKVNPFVGMGVGIGIHDALVDVIDYTNDGNSTAMITPRVGVELWRHLRLTLTTNLSCRHYNNLNFTVGYVIGGGKKNK